MSPHITLVCDRRFHQPAKRDWYIDQVLLEDELLQTALTSSGCQVSRTHWDDPNFDWASTDAVVIRATWDYFHRYHEFEQWLQHVSSLTKLINPLSTIQWNINKKYLLELESLGHRIPPTQLIQQGDSRSLAAHCNAAQWTGSEFILKSCISGSARHTYRFQSKDAHVHEATFQALIAEESMLLQQYQHRITSEGEYTLMYFGKQYSHAVLKRAKPGDFRVQDDFGGTVAECNAPIEVRLYADALMQSLPVKHAYARVDVMIDNNGTPVLAELEMIEPELWLRMHPPAANLFAQSLLELLEV